MAHRNQKNLNDMLKQGGYNGDVDDSQLPPGLSGASKQILQRVKALKKIQLESLEIESKFYAEVHKLEVQFQPFFDKIAEKRKAVVTGYIEPSVNECDVPLINELDQEELQRIEDNAPVEQGNYSKGVPAFWYNVLNMTQVADDIQEYDVPILKDYLEDITSEIHVNPPGFSLIFHFAENPYFSNSILKKYYQLQMEVPHGDSNPFHYEGPIIVKCQGTVIDWHPGKNVTVKVIKKAPKKGQQAGKPMTKTVSCDSFFNFFMPKVTEESPDMDPEYEEQLHHDFELGQVIRDEIIPRAVLYFTGEAVEDDDMYDGLDEEEDDTSQNSDHDE